MYVRVMKFILGPDRQWEAEHIADILAAVTKQQPGNQGFLFFADHETGEYQTTSFWETKAHWDTSFRVVWPFFLEMIGDDFQWQPTVQMYETYEPRAISLARQ